MNTTDNQNHTPGPIHVWTDDTGNRYAAQELSPGKVGFYAYRKSGRDSYGTTDQSPGQQTEAAVYYALSNHYYADGLSWIEQRELNDAARNQDTAPERSLADAISYPERCTIDDSTLDKISALLTHRCRVSTLQTIRHRLANPAGLRNYGIYSRLQISPTVHYCAGQYYPAELAEIRRLLIKN